MSRILIVDDDLHIRELVRVFLRKEGFDVHTPQLVGWLTKTWPWYYSDES